MTGHEYARKVYDAVVKVNVTLAAIDAADPYEQRMANYPGFWPGYTYTPSPADRPTLPAPAPVRCECGSAEANCHSHWCPLSPHYQGL